MDVTADRPASSWRQAQSARDESPGLVADGGGLLEKRVILK